MIMKKYLLLMLLSSLLMLTACSNNDYNLGFKLGSTEENVVEFIQANNLECRYENKTRSGQFVLRVYDFEYKNLEMNTIRLAFSNNKLCYIEHRIHNSYLFDKSLEDNDNISLTIEYLKEKYGEPKENLNYEDFEGKYYWGKMESKFMIIDPCTEDYIKIHIGDSSLDPVVAEFYRELLLN